MTTRNRCRRKDCRKPLSIYNKTGECWSHQVADPTQGGHADGMGYTVCSSSENRAVIRTRMQEYGFSDSWRT